MKVKGLIKKLQKVNGELEVVVDMDENGFYFLMDAKVELDEDQEEVLNLISSSES